MCDNVVHLRLELLIVCVNIEWWKLTYFYFIPQLLRIGVNLKNFPTSAVPATFAILFQLGIAAVLLLYVLFWLKVRLSLCAFVCPLLEFDPLSSIRKC